MRSSLVFSLIVMAFVTGFCLAVVLIVLSLLYKATRSDVYSLSHWKLNVKTPFESMWMNMGYWTNEKGGNITAFPEACARLLQVMLTKARINTSSSSTHAFLDLGIGCGDQTIELARLIPNATPLTFSYVGITLNPAQFDTAALRISSVLSHSPLFSSPPSTAEAEPAEPAPISIFRADAAAPNLWDQPLQKAITCLTQRADVHERWLLALDCMYHFRPSRRPILSHASSHLGLDLLAFDLILNDKAPLRQRLAAKALGLLMGCPAGAFLTWEQYVGDLAKCGYDVVSGVERYDVSGEVFPGISGYIDGRKRALWRYGVAMGGIGVAGKVFRWFGRTGVVQATIIVARAKRKQS